MSTLAGVILTAIMIGSIVSGASYFFVSNSSSSFASELRASDSKVNSQIAAVQDDSSKLKSLLTFIQDDGSKAKTQINDLGKRISDLNDDNGKLKTSNDKLSSQFGAVQDDNAKLKAANDKLNPQLGALQEDNSKLKAANDKLNSQLTDVSANLKTIADAAGIPINNPEELKKFIEQQKIIEGAKQEGKLVWYTTAGVQNDAIRNAFERTYPFITVELVTAGGTPLANRFISEFDKGTRSADTLLIGQGVIGIILEKDRLAKYVPKNSEWVPTDLRDKDSRYIPYAPVIFSIAYNTKLLSKEQAPKSFAELVDPKWSGKLGSVDPKTNIAIVNVYKAWEKQYGEDLLRKLGTQGIRNYADFNVALDKLATGEIPIYVAAFTASVEPRKLAGQPIDWVRTSDNTYFQQYAWTGIAANAPHPNAAKLWTDWFLSKAGQQVAADNGALTYMPEIRLSNPDTTTQGKKLVLMEAASDADRSAFIAKYPALAPQQFKASGFSLTNDVTALLAAAGNDRGIYAKNGLAPEFVYTAGRTTGLNDLKDMINSGLGIGWGPSGDVLLLRVQGVPIKIVATVTATSPAIKIYVKADSPIMTVKDLDGKKVGVRALLPDVTARLVQYMSNRVGIKPLLVALGNTTLNLAALESGAVDAIYDSTSITLSQVDSGRLRIVANVYDYFPTPWAGLVVWATEDTIQKQPNLVRGFVKATLETVTYLKANPEYSSTLLSKTIGIPKATTDKSITLIDWTPAGGNLASALANILAFSKDVGVLPANVDVKIDDLADLRFLPAQ